MNYLKTFNQGKTAQIVIILFTLGLATSCVSQLKYDRVTSEVSSLRNEKDEALKKAESSNLNGIRLDKENKAFEDEVAKLKLDSTQSGAMYRKNKLLLDDVFDKYDRLDKSYKSLLGNSTSERSFTEKEVQRKEADLIKKEKELEGMKTQIMAAQAELDKKKEEAVKLSQVLGTKDNRIKDMEAQIAAKDKKMADFKAKMTEALLVLNNAELEVTLKDGKVYVMLPQQTLFGIGSYVLDKNGKTAINQVSKILVQNPDLEVSVEGHTDNTPYRPYETTQSVKKGASKKSDSSPECPQDNWDLSCLRAATVAREMYSLGVLGNRIGATGKGEFYPLDISNSEIAKMKNRRIEIVISPKLTALYDILNKDEKK